MQAEANPNWFAASVTTVDGQQFSIGDTDITFSIQSCTKPIACEWRGRGTSRGSCAPPCGPRTVTGIASPTRPTHHAADAVAVEDRSLDYVHRHGPGFEPSGLSFNEVSLNSKGRPHNPYINSGA